MLSVGGRSSEKDSSTTKRLSLLMFLMGWMVQGVLLLAGHVGYEGLHSVTLVIARMSFTKLLLRATPDPAPEVEE